MFTSSFNYVWTVLKCDRWRCFSFTGVWHIYGYLSGLIRSDLALS